MASLLKNTGEIIPSIHLSWVLNKNGTVCKTTLQKCPAVRKSSKLAWNMAGGVMQIGLTSLWSPNHSEVPGRLILQFVTKKTTLLCAHLCLRWTCEVCFHSVKLLAAPSCFGSLLLGVIGSPVAVTVSPNASSGYWSFWEECCTCWAET